MQTLRRTIHPETRVLDARAGLVEYVASDETLDSYGEIIRAAGWRFTHFQKNAPLVDSHDYDTIGKQLGTVVDFRVKGRQLVETVRWAVDVPENTLAQLGWKMTEAGYLKAVSVGFWPVKSVTRSEPKEFAQHLRDLGLAPDSKVRTIYTEQEQIELSAVVIGANPSALARGYKSGLLTEADIELLAPSRADFVRRIGEEIEPHRRTAFSFAPTQIPQPNPNMSTRSTIPSTLGRTFAATSRLSLLAACEAVVADPQKRLWLRAVAKKLTGSNPSMVSTEEHAVIRGLTTGDSSLGQALSVCEPLSEDLYALLQMFGAWARLGVVEIPLGKTKLASLTGRAVGSWLTPANQGAAILKTATLNGASISPECATLGALIDISGELLADGKTTFEAAFLMALTEGLNYRLDLTAFQGTGVDDLQNGGQTGIFAAAGVPVANATAGHSNFGSLNDADFIRVIAAVAPSALQRECCWFINPVFLPTLFLLRDGHRFMFEPPTAAGEDWTLFGFPIVWTGAAPAVDLASAKVAAFGRTDAYTVAMRQDFEIKASFTGPGFSQNLTQVRALARARCQIRDATSLATLALAAS